MATTNPFDLLASEDTEDPMQLIAAQQPKIAPKKDLAPASKAAHQQQQSVKQPAKLPSKPLPPAQAVRDAKSESSRGGGRSGGRGFGRGHGGGFNRDSTNNENSFVTGVISAGQGAIEDADTGKTSERRGGHGGLRGPFRGGRRGGFNNDEGGDGLRPRRTFDRRSGTGRGNEFKRDGAGRGNWGTQTDELSQMAEEAVEESDKTLDAEKQPPAAEVAEDSSKENPSNEPEEKEVEDKVMTLEEYEKVLEEKKKALQSLKVEERKVDTKEFESMQQLTNKKSADDVFIKVGSDKDKRKELAEKEEKAKKSVSINEFLKPAEGERYYSPGGRGRGRGSRGGYNRGGSMINNNTEAPKIEDPGQFPTLGGK